MKVGRVISAVCAVLASMLVIGETLQSLGLGAAEAKEAKRAQKARKPNRRLSREHG